jgi:hypothetical protein
MAFARRFRLHQSPIRHHFAELRRLNHKKAFLDASPLGLASLLNNFPRSNPDWLINLA